MLRMKNAPSKRPQQIKHVQNEKGTRSTTATSYACLPYIYRVTDKSTKAPKKKNNTAK